MATKATSIIEVFLAKHPEMRFGLHVFLGMHSLREWQIKRALAARAAKPQKRFKHRR